MALKFDQEDKPEPCGFTLNPFQILWNDKKHMWEGREKAHKNTEKQEL